MSNTGYVIKAYIAEHYDELKQALTKNGTYDEDVFNETIVKCYENITKFNKRIEAFDQYFFWCCRNNYICNQELQLQRN